MGELTILDRIREFIGDIAWNVFLWSHRWTEDKYWEIMDEYRAKCINIGTEEIK